MSIETSFDDQDLGNDKARWIEQKRAYVNQVGQFASALSQSAVVAALLVYGWMKKPLADRINAYMAKRSDLKKQAAEIAKPVIDAVNFLGEGETFDLFAAIDGATIAQKDLLGKIASVAMEGIKVAEEAIVEVKQLAVAAADEEANELTDAKKSLADAGWPAEVWGNDHAFEFNARRRLKFQAAANRARGFKDQQLGFANEVAALRRKVGETQAAAAKLALRELKV